MECRGLIIGNIPIFEFSLLVLFTVGAIYWFGFKRRAVIASETATATATQVDVAD